MNLLAENECIRIRLAARSEWSDTHAQERCPLGMGIADKKQPRHRLSGLALASTVSFLILALSGCASKPEIAVDSYCVIAATETLDMRDPGLQRLIPVNQGAVLTKDDNWNRLCKGAINKGR